MDNEKYYDLEEELDSYKGQWFVINCNSGHEERVKSDLVQKVESSSLGDKIFDIRISKAPIAGKNGKVTEKNKFPGYIFINMLMSDETWFIVRNTPGVTGFIGSSGKGTKPLPLTSEEVAKMLQANEPTNNKAQKNTNNGQTMKKEKVLYSATFKLNDVVKITNGPFTDKEGQVVNMDDETGVAIVNIEMFGRITPAEVPYSEAELAYKG